MRIAGTIIGVILVLFGIIWTLQGTNVWAGSSMSGQSQWTWTGLVILVLGLVALWWVWIRKA